MAMAVGDICEVRFVCKLLGQIAHIIRHYRVSAFTGTPVFSDVIDELSDGIHLPLRDVICAEASYLGADIKKVWPLPTGEVVPNTSGTGVGEGEDGILPMQVCGLIQLFRLVGDDKTARGRAYIPFPAMSFNNPANGQPTATYVARLNTLGTFLVSAIASVAGGNTFTIVPVTYKKADHSTIDLNDFHSSSLWATQRRRGLRDGPDQLWPPVV